MKPLLLPLLVALSLAPLPSAAPLEAQEQRYAEWAAPDFPPEEYALRRARLLEELRALGDGVLLVPGAEGTSHGPSFRQLDDLHYLTGLETPRSLLVADTRSGATVLYVPRRDPRFENPGRPNDFPGRPLADDPDLARGSGIEIRAREEFDDALAELVATRRLWVNLESADASPEAVTTGLTVDLSPTRSMILHLRAVDPEVRIDNAFAAFARVRAVKSPAEIDRIRRVARITESAIARAAARIRPGVDERTLEGWFELGCKEGGAQRIPFHPIVKSGPNSLWAWRILASHYDRRNRAMAAGDLVVFDVGCELDHYVSDVGRTFPVSGVFTPEQAEALALQRRVADAIIGAIAPGVTLAEATRAGVEAMPEEARPHMQTGSFYSHHLGLSTGDPALTGAPLEAGMVFTVEPWYYDHEAGISVFVEDMILVTDDGAEVLTSSLPRTAAELASMVGGACTLDAPYRFGREGGMALSRLEARLIPPDTLRLERRFTFEDRVEACTTRVPACRTPGEIDAGSPIDVGRVAEALGHPRVQVALDSEGRVYGADVRPMDGAVWVLRRGPGNRSDTGFAVGEPCRVGDACRAVPPALSEVRDLLEALVAQEAARPVCEAVAR